MTDWEKIRDYFPAVKNSMYLNNSGGGPISVITHAEASAFYDQMLAIGDTPDIIAELDKYKAGWEIIE